MPLINWLWLEDLLVRASEAEIRAFGEAHPDALFFAFCLEFDGVDGSFRYSYGTRDAVEATVEQKRREGGRFCYREAELHPDGWEHREEGVTDAEGQWTRLQPVLAPYRELMREDPEPDVAEFYWLRFEYLAECAIRRLIDRDAFRYLPREAEFVAYSLCRDERLEELEDRLEKQYPAYRRATCELLTHPRPGELEAGICDGTTCGRSLARAVLYRCTYCQGWYCENCSEVHWHPELSEKRPFFA
jgi:hypothetical protein